MTKQQTIIEPNNAGKRYWRDLWDYRELFYFLAWRDVLVKYKQTVIGLAWSLIRPLLTIVVFTLVFGYIAKLDQGGDVPYAIMVCVGTLPWAFFASSFTETSNSLISNSNLLTKVYFPRLIIPVSSIIVNLIDFFISFLILGGLMLYFQYVPSWRIVFMPLFLLLAFVTALGTGLFIASLNVKYRDFRIIVPFIVQLGIYISPVGFKSQDVLNSEKLPAFAKVLYTCNPMVGVIDGFRWSVLGNNKINFNGLLISCCISLFFLILGISYFRKTEKTFADII